MARVNHVKAAEQRYATVPVLDDNGEQVWRTLHRKDGTPKTNKRGEPVRQRVTKKDTTRPLPNRKCGRCGKEIEPGMPYLWWANKLPNARSGYKQIRCVDHPPTLAERTPGRAGQLMGMQDEWSKRLADCTTIDDLTSARDDIAGEIRDFAQEFIDSADNMESGFGHETYQSQELREKGEAIEQVADDLEQVKPEFDEDEAEGFDEDEIRRELAMDLFGIDDPDEDDALEPDQLAQLKEAVSEREQEHESEVQDATDDAVESFRQEIEDKTNEVEV